MKQNIFIKWNVLLYFLTIFTAAFLLPINTVMATAPNKIKIMADACLTCHGPNGSGSGKIPELKGLEKSDITESLFGFKSGDEKSTIMGRYAKALSDNEINLLGEYFSTLDK
ncbi:MAG: c-type cytochrome [Gammaproteobacteria bacterium]|nr:c-type cytochrome [Gammaproteobacteria bacterium]